ncbi:isoinhibitor K-like [Ixodes scapularis]|uniref:isoinhibitor K-like n=1 Tax=Ixodes scapularis TaxID=6945 RepID=UPI001A9DCA80|nr:isoinhibitor K-like [Ixodes scapularis]
MHFIFMVSVVILACSVLNTQGFNPDCNLPKDDGPCRARIPSFYFDNVTRTCHMFMYGGCEGNGNNFESPEQCKEECEAKD